MPWIVASAALMVAGAVTAGIGLGTGHQAVFEIGAAVLCIGLFGWMCPRRGRLVGEFRGCAASGYDLAGITVDTCPECGRPPAIRRAQHPDNEPVPVAQLWSASRAAGGEGVQEAAEVRDR